MTSYQERDIHHVHTKTPMKRDHIIRDGEQGIQVPLITSTGEYNNATYAIEWQSFIAQHETPQNQSSITALSQTTLLINNQRKSDLQAEKARLQDQHVSAVLEVKDRQRRAYSNKRGDVLAGLDKSEQIKIIWIRLIKGKGTVVLKAQQKEQAITERLKQITEEEVTLEILDREKRVREQQANQEQARNFKEEETRWAIQSRERLVFHIANNPKEAERLTAAYQEKMKRNPSMEEVIPYIRLYLEQGFSENANPELFKKWLSSFFPGKTEEQCQKILQQLEETPLQIPQVRFIQEMMHAVDVLRFQNGDIRHDFLTLVRRRLIDRLKIIGVSGIPSEELNPYLIPKITIVSESKTNQPLEAENEQKHNFVIAFRTKDEVVRVKKEALDDYIRVFIQENEGIKPAPSELVKACSDGVKDICQSLAAKAINPHLRKLGKKAAKNTGASFRYKNEYMQETMWRMLVNLPSKGNNQIEIVRVCKKDKEGYI